MTGLLLVAGGGLAREVLAVAGLRERYDHLGVLDDDAARWGDELHGVPVLGGLGLITEYDDHELVVCAGRGAVRRTLVARLSALGVTEDRYARILHPSVEVPAGCTVGVGSVLLAGTVLTADVTIGRHVVCMPRVVLTHDDDLADYATLAAGVSLGGAVTVGAAAYLGMNASVRESRHVGPDAVLGMGAALLHDLPASETWAGVPARPIVPALLSRPSTEVDS